MQAVHARCMAQAMVARCPDLLDGQMARSRGQAHAVEQGHAMGCSTSHAQRSCAPKPLLLDLLLQQRVGARHLGGLGHLLRRCK